MGRGTAQPLHTEVILNINNNERNWSTRRATVRVEQHTGSRYNLNFNKLSDLSDRLVASDSDEQLSAVKCNEAGLKAGSSQYGVNVKFLLNGSRYE